MKVCFITTSSFRRDPRALAEVAATRKAGHQVVGLSRASDEPAWVANPARAPIGDRIARKAPADRLIRQARSLGADLYVPVQAEAVPIAAAATAGRLESSFLTKPTWPDTASVPDLKWRAPDQPALTLPASGTLPRLHAPGFRGAPPESGGRVVIIYRRTETNPGRYLEAALRRRGVETIHATGLDWRSIPDTTTAVIIVESPLPALAVHGKNPGVPVIFWVHHGEHHLDTNLRLQRRYGAHLVALAHSWHLAYRFQGVVDRLPFAVAPEITPSEFVPHPAREFDVAFVGRRSADSRYVRRQETLDRIEASLGADRVASDDNLSPQEMMGLYRDSRIVPDDGWGRHLPITMRVFEATGAGAALVSRTAPGTDLLFEPDAEYLPVGEDPTSQVVGLAAGETEPIARSGHGRAWRNHTYDHRVDEILSLVPETTSHLPTIEPVEPQAGIAAAVASFPDAQRILDLETGVEAELEDREVWPYHRGAERAEPGTFHVAAISGGTPQERMRSVAAARLAVITEPGLACEIEPLVEEVHGQCDRFEIDGSAVFTFGSAGYRVSNRPDLTDDI